MELGKLHTDVSTPKIGLFGNMGLPLPRETAGISTAPQVTRSKPPAPIECEAGCDHSASQKNCTKRQKKETRRESAKVKFTGRIKESGVTTKGDGQRFRVTLLQEGLGNLADCFYYTAQAIESCPPIFDGKKLFVDHPSSIEEEIHPERSVKDVAGYFENCAVEIDDSGRSNLVGDLVVMPGVSFDQYRALMLEALKYEKKHAGQNLVGLSINANGDFENVQLDTFLESENIPETCKPKLIEAAAAGITMIRPVREMKSAFSCDLVTEPGAGGSINSLLEGAKHMSKEKDKEAKQKQEEAGGDAGAPSDKGGGHDDAAQDQQMIAQMLKKYLGHGDDSEPSEEESALMKQAYGESKAMGMDHEEAMKCAGYNLKMAKHLQGKKPADGGMGDEPKQESGAEAPGDSGSVPPKDQKTKESNRAPHVDVKLAAEVAALRAKLEKRDLEDFIEASLRESKLPMAATKKLRECFKGVKNQKEVSEKLSVFKEAYRLGGEADGGGFVLSAERTNNESGESGLSFADCVEE